MNPDLIPREGMTFRSDEEARDFYEQYAELARFGVKLSNRKPYSRVMRCTNSGMGKFYKGNEDLRVRNKTTKKTSCNAHLKFTRVYDSEGNEASLVLEKANLFHNHYLLTPSKTKHQHKRIDSIIFDIIDELQDAGVSSQQIKNVLQNMHGGHAELVPVTTQDIANRKDHLTQLLVLKMQMRWLVEWVLNE
jgi:hypothetical protein